MAVASDFLSRAEASVIPRLLVSVRNVAEAQAAIAGGCDIIDVKEPSRGSLGRADLAQIRDIAEFTHASGQPCSVALGEVSETDSQTTNESSASFSIQFAKLGLAGLRHRPSWQSDWQSAMDSSATASDKCPTNGWVAVIYADAEAAAAPDPIEIIHVVTRGPAELSNRICGVLVDTYSKSSGTVLDALSVSELSVLAEHTQESGRFFALAGRVNLGMLATIAHIPVDVIAVRSAACVGEDRTAEVDHYAVRQFRDEMETAFRATRQRESVSAVQSSQ